MNQSVILDSAYLPSEGRRKRARLKRQRKSKLDKFRSVIEQWLLSRAQTANKRRFSQRRLCAVLKLVHQVNVSQAALSRFCAANGWEGFFHE